MDTQKRAVVKNGSKQNEEGDPPAPQERLCVYTTDVVDPDEPETSRRYFFGKLTGVRFGNLVQVRSLDNEKGGTLMLIKKNEIRQAACIPAGVEVGVDKVEINGSGRGRGRDRQVCFRVYRTLEQITGETERVSAENTWTRRQLNPAPWLSKVFLDQGTVNDLFPRQN